MWKSGQSESAVVASYGTTRSTPGQGEKGGERSAAAEEETTGDGAEGEGRVRREAAG